MSMSKRLKLRLGPDNGALLPVSVPLPSLSSSMNQLYNSLDVFNRGVFNKVFRFLWGVVNDKGVNSAGLVSRYWLLARFVDLAPCSPSGFLLLSYIYFVSGKGVKIIHSSICAGVLPDVVRRTDTRVLNDLKRWGYITRHTKNTDEPYLRRARSRQPVFIKMTNKGVDLIEGMEKDIDKYLRNTSLNDLTGNKKPG